MARAEEAKARPARTELSEERKREIMGSTPVLTEKALAEKKRPAQG